MGGLHWIVQPLPLSGNPEHRNHRVKPEGAEGGAGRRAVQKIDRTVDVQCEARS